ncbi:MAG: metallophosphoesterase, partial [Bergeyella zoohelcum]|nr:metallophosphoesterase [Bergeyella zoohelcum]
LQWTTTLFLAFLMPKLIVSLFLLIDDIFRLLQFGISKLSAPEKHFPERRKFISLAGFGFAGILSALFLDGVIFGKYRHKVRRVKLKIKNLPESFKGYKIVQISDVHSGSFLHPEKLKPAFDLINEQNADLVLFTGDLVNSKADEFLPLLPLFASIKAKDGKFSVLGNHDYGYYAKWDTKEKEEENLRYLIDLQKKAGFDLLRNEYRSIEKNGEQLYIVGVENWGLPPFPQFGDLDKATAGIPANTAKILMSHDPTHFDEKVKHHASEIALSLSGHTHGMQFGLDLKNTRWSPVQYRYQKWADLYESNGRYLYVNRGFGVVGYSGRVGILPEITLFELY